MRTFADLGRGAAPADQAGAERGAASAARPRRARALALALFALVVAVVVPEGAHAQKKKKRPPEPEPAPAVDVKAITQKIRAGDAAQVIEGLGAARDAGAGAAQAAPAIEELLGRGATVPVAKAAIEALGAMGQGSSSAAIRPYARHRTVELRREALKALSSTKGAEAIAAFQEGLRSGDGVVRGYSASGLGNLGVKEALPDLFVALDRDITEAAAAIGQLCDPAACKRFVERLGKLSFEVMTSGIDPILFRQKPLPDELLLEIVLRLRDLGTPEAGRYLADVGSRWPAGGSAAVKQAIDAAVPSIPGARP